MIKVILNIIKVRNITKNEYYNIKYLECCEVKLLP